MPFSLTDNQILSKLKIYIKSQDNIYQTHEATEYTYRTPLTNFLNELMPNKDFFMESKHIRHNAPDYSIKLKDKHGNDGINIGHLETKLPGDNLESYHHNGPKGQFTRYKHSFRNVIFTDYAYFDVFENGEKKNIKPIRIAHVEDGHFIITNDALKQVKILISFINNMDIPEITSGLKLASIMANQAKIMADSTNDALNDDKHNNNGNTSLLLLYKQFKHDLLHNLSIYKFTDYVAQTITYGMFAARIYDKNDKHFSADIAAEKIPNTDPFLKRLFNSMTGVNADERIKWCINMLANTFRHVNVDKVLHRFSNNDPVFHFYEDFLEQYNPKIKKSRGVWYTNKNICHFIVSSIDWLLENKLHISGGLASMESISKNNKLIPKVQILDPATGTGTFLAETVKQIRKHFNGNEGMWPSFVQHQLINRLNAFEILMVPYTIAHLKLLSTIKQTTNMPLKLKGQQFHIYLADALAKPAEKKPGKLAPKIDNYMKLEKDKSDRVKDSLPVMVVMGNPPYSGLNSPNHGAWIEKLLDDYKKNLHDPSIKAVNDDYVKFIRVAEKYITHNNYGKGIIGYITNSTYLTSPSCRIMRKNLAKTFDDIYILDLHGSSYDHRTKHQKVNGKFVTIPDQNVFNIQTAVAIVFFVKKSNSNNPAKIHYTDKIDNIQMVDRRYIKLKLLGSHNISQLKFRSWTFNMKQKYPIFTPTQQITNDHYNDKDSISIYDAFNTKEHGVLTGNDKFTVNSHYNSMSSLLKLFKQKKLSDIINDFPNERGKTTKKNKRKWSLQKAFNDIQNHDADIIKFELRPLDFQYTIMTRPSFLDKKTNSSKKSGNSDGFLMWPRWKSSKLLITSSKLMKQLKIPKSLALVIPRQVTKEGPYRHAIVSNCPINNRVLSLKRGGGFQFPIRGPKSISGFKNGRPIYNYYSNFSKKFLNKLSNILGRNYKQPNRTERINILAWIIGILWAPQYTKKYESRLKKDFARIPIPHSINDFNKVIKIGRKLIKAFILKGTLDSNIKFPKVGTMLVSNNSQHRKYKNGKLFFNKEQYFSGITNRQYKFNLGGFQILKKWFQDRKGTKLNDQDIIKFKEIIGAINLINKCQNNLNQLKFLNDY